MNPSHLYKCWPRFFNALADGSKTFEVRKDDRATTPRTGDTVLMIEWDPHTDRALSRQLELRVGYVLRGDGLVLPKGWLVFGVERIGGAK